jgi:N-carbamoylputrescine amidase
MSTAPFTLGLIQQAVQPTAEATVAEAERGIREAASRGAQIVCLQELFNAPYFCKVTDAERFDLAEPIPGATVERMQRLAKELSVVIVVPIFEKRGPGLYHNSAAVVDADGALLGVYRKMHIPDDPLYHEKYYFTPGEIYQHDEAKPASGFRVFHTRYATIGVLICWDQWYPEAARITSLMGAQVLLYPTAIGWHPKEKAEWGADGLEFFGHSFVSDPFGRLIAEAGTTPEILIAECDPKVIEYTRRNWPFLRDRRIDAYGAITSRYLG